MREAARFIRALVLAGGFAAVSAYGSLPERRPALPPLAGSAPVALDPEIASLYRQRGFAPLWVRGGQLHPAAVEAAAGADPLPAELEAALARAQAGDRTALARADLLITRKIVERLDALHAPPAHETMRYFDNLEPGPPPVAEWLAAAAGAPDLSRGLASILRVNPALDGLIRGLRSYRARWASLPQVRLPAEADFAKGLSGPTADLLRHRLGLGPGILDEEVERRIRDYQLVHGLSVTGEVDRPTINSLNRGSAHYERLIQLNIDRARAIPGDPGGRYILVDTASAQLWLVEDGRAVDRMKVIVGKNGMKTPVMAGLIRYAAYNPYWNLPPDLIRERARRALRRGPAAIAAERLEILSDWSPGARRLAARSVDWRAVATGRKMVAMRQRPGPHNVMGRVKFMMPNELGIYLHDTPNREHFARDDRRISSGCVRVADAPRLARWLFEGRPLRPTGAAEEKFDLAEPVPVFITHLTALPTNEGVRFLPDRYGLDREGLAAFVRASSSSTPS